MSPTFINLVIQLIKATSLVSLITLTDMTFRAKEISQVYYEPVPIYLSLLAAYFLACYPFALFGRWVAQRVSPTAEGATWGLISTLQSPPSP